MGLIFLPTNVALPTRLDLLCSAFIGGDMDVPEFEDSVERLLSAGTADELPSARLGLTREWR